MDRLDNSAVSITSTTENQASGNQINLASTTDQIDLTVPTATASGTVSGVPDLRVSPRYLREADPRVIDLTPSDARVEEIPAGFYARYGKRVFDVALVLISLPLWLPLYLVIALLVLVVEGRPVHFAAARPGHNLKEFHIIKFRTMRRDANEVLDQLLEENDLLAQEFKLSAKLRNDPRVTGLGRRLRRLSLDELPQLFNVLTGEMSLVGPRPPASWDELDELYGSRARTTLQNRPGLTGLWQVSRGDEKLSYDERVQLDVDYTGHCTLFNDLKIIARTVPTVWRGHGSF